MNRIYLSILKKVKKRESQFFLLLDPDKIKLEQLERIIKNAIAKGVDGFLLGSSILLTDYYDKFVALAKHIAQNVPVVLFPGSVFQVSKEADAILFLSLISGRNPEYLINQQVLSAVHIKRARLEAISTAYMLIGTGKMTSVEYISNTKPIPGDKPDIAVLHAIAAEMLGFKMIYLEAGSGASISVPNRLISEVAKAVSIPIIVGGGIRDAEVARQKVEAGASIVVCGNFFETEKYDTKKLETIAKAIHSG